MGSPKLEINGQGGRVGGSRRGAYTEVRGVRRCGLLVMVTFGDAACSRLMLCKILRAW